jgi:hypothetical protein
MSCYPAARTLWPCSWQVLPVLSQSHVRSAPSSDSLFIIPWRHTVFTLTSTRTTHLLIMILYILITSIQLYVSGWYILIVQFTDNSHLTISIPPKYMGFWKWCRQLHWWKRQSIRNIKTDSTPDKKSKKTTISTLSDIAEGPCKNVELTLLVCLKLPQQIVVTGSP